MSDNHKLYNLLLIISSPQEASAIQNMLKSKNFNILIASDEQEALCISKEVIPDIILLDIEVSAPREFSVLQLLKRKKITKSIPILFFTTVEYEDIISECLNFNNTDFITKPFRKKELLIRIRHQLSLLTAQQIIRRQNERLKRTMESRNKLYSVIAHDLRSPIGTIKMINATIESEKDRINDPKIRRLFEMVNETTEEAFNLLENLLRWSRNQTGKTKVIPQHFDLFAMIRQISSLASMIAKAKNITLSYQQDAPLMIYADEDMVKTILRNLLSNAIKFTYSGGTVDIRVTHTDEQVTVTVKDNGRGINKETLNRLLKGDQSITTNGTQNEKGSGLGLLLCREFIRMNKGKLWCESEENKGTAFYFSLPLERKESEKSTPTSQTQ